MSEQASVFTNDRILDWMKYFSDRTEMSVETTKLMDVSVKNKNVIPAVEANHWVLVFADAGYPSLFYELQLIYKQTIPTVFTFNRFFI